MSTFAGPFAVLAWLAAVLTLVAVHRVEHHLDRIDQELHAICTHGESSVGPVTIRDGRVSGSTQPAVTGCQP